VVVLSGEIGTAMQINSMKWHKNAATLSDAQCEGFSIYLGLCADDQLSNSSYDGNYIAGTKTLVYSTDPLFVNQADEWAEIILDEPYWYNGTDNLIIEIQWDNATHDNSYYNHEWLAGDNRCIFTQSSTDILSYNMLPHMILAGSLSLENSTFAGIKVELGR